MIHPWERSYAPGVSWNGAIEFEPMPAALDRAAAKWPNNVAIEFFGHRLTFAELRDLAQRVAKGLQALGVGAETSVALHLPNSPHFVACFFGVLYAGGRVVPISPEAAANERRLQLVDSSATVLVTLDTSLPPPAAAELRQAGLRTIVVCRLEDFRSDEPASRRDQRPKPEYLVEPEVPFAALISNDGMFRSDMPGTSVDEIAVLQFTGGTTGESKAAMLTHRNFSVVPHAIGTWVQDLMNDGSRVLVVLPLHHVFGLVVMQVSIAFGMRMVLHLGFNSERVLQAIERDRITILFAVPTMYAALVSHRDAGNHDLSSLQLCGSGGAPLSPEVFENFRALTGQEILEGYSLTEITDIGTWQPIGGRVRPGSVGLPLPQTVVEIVDLETGLDVLPIGQSGEVCFSGPQLMKGYWRRPDETEWVLRGGRFHSGDIGYLDDDGYLVLVDRKKNMILSGGMNVFPGKIERAIEQHPSVYEVCVIGIPDAALGQVTKAFIALKTDAAAFSYRDLRTFLADKLAGYEMPVEMEIRDHLPKTAVGKLSKQALIANQSGGSRDLRNATAAAASRISGRNKVLEQLRSVLAELRAGNAGADDQLEQPELDSGAMLRMERELAEHFAATMDAVGMRAAEISALQSRVSLSPTNGAAHAGAGPRRLALADPARRRKLVRQAVREEVTRVLSLPDAEPVIFEELLSERGLDSLMAVELRNSLAKRLEVELPATLAFDHPTPEAIAQHAEELIAGGASRDVGVGAATTGHSDQECRLVPLSAGQQRLWFLDRLAPNTPLYNLHVAWRIRGQLDLPLLRRCFSVLAQRHETARTQFVEVHGEPRALILPREEECLNVTFVDLRGDPDRLATLERLSLEHRTGLFNLTRSPLWRVAVLAMEQSEHVILLTQHHIVSDALSLTRLFDELVRLYRSGDADEGALPDMRLHYSDYTRWQVTRVREETHLASLAWWKQQLAGVPRLDLPESRSTLAPSHAGHRCEIRLSAELSGRIRDLARREGGTLFHTLLTAWACVLYRHSGQSEFPIGTFVGGRDRPEFADLVGFFVNTVVLRCDLSGNPTFGGLLRRVREVVINALRHQHVPFDAVLREVGATRGQGLNPLIQANFDLLSALRGEETPDASWEWLDASRGEVGVDGTAKFNISLTLIDDPAGIRGAIEYATDLFDDGAVRRLGKHFEVLLGAAAAAPGLLIDGLPLLSAEERGALLQDWNQTDYPLEGPSCVHEAVALQARQRPDATAVLFGEQRLTYGQLEQRANQLANALRAMGMPAAARVGICLDRSCEMIIALLAILKVGGAYVPLDPSYPLDRLTYMLEDAKVFALVTTSPIAARWPDHPVRMLRLDVDAEIIDRQSVEPVEEIVSPESLAYVIYTSGSTGQPKGVEIPHAALRNTLAHFARQLAISDEDVLLAVTSLSFDIAALEIFLPLMHGAAIRLLPREHALDGYALAREVSHATIMQATPATWRLLLDAGWTGSPKLRALCGGEALQWPWALKLLDRASEVWNCYGPTETTVWSTTWRVERDADRALLGRGIANTRLYVLDRNGELVPIGVPGELYIGGASVGRGYFGRDTLTADRFVPDRYSGLENARMYRTGDKVRWTAGGNLEFLGRLDHQVKLRGFRIELGEIETIFSQYPGVRSCIVALQGSGDAARLVAYYVGANAQDLPSESLREHLAGKLPPYMVPSTFVRLDEFPLTPNKKVDRSALPAPESPAGHAFPRIAATDLQRSMVVIWRELLDVEPDVQRSFFEQGGTSLQIVRLQHMMRERLGVEATIAELMAYPSIEALTQRIEERRTSPIGMVARRAEAAETSLGERHLDIATLSQAELSDTLRARLERLRSERQALT